MQVLFFLILTIVTSVKASAWPSEILGDDAAKKLFHLRFIDDLEVLQAWENTHLSEKYRNWTNEEKAPYRSVLLIFHAFHHFKEHIRSVIKQLNSIEMLFDAFQEHFNQMKLVSPIDPDSFEIHECHFLRLKQLQDNAFTCFETLFTKNIPFSKEKLTPTLTRISLCPPISNKDIASSLIQRFLDLDYAVEQELKNCKDIQPHLTTLSEQSIAMQENVSNSSLDEFPSYPPRRKRTPLPLLSIRRTNCSPYLSKSILSSVSDFFTLTRQKPQGFHGTYRTYYNPNSSDLDTEESDSE